MNANQPEPKWLIWLEWGVLLAIVALAAFLRYWKLGQVPPGFNSDEAVGAMGALTTLREGLQYSYEGQGGGGALGFYFAAASFYLFGPSIAAIRGVAAWAGVVSIFANYWAIRELFRLEGLNRARWIAGLSTLALAVSLWHIRPSRIAFAGIGVPFLMLPSVYFLWRGLNRQLVINNEQLANQKSKIKNQKSITWLFVLSGFFLGALMYIYLSGVFAPPFYAVFFIAQWLLVKLVRRFNGRPVPDQTFLTGQFRNLFATALTAAILLLPLLYVLLTRSDLEPGTTRVSQASFLNPLINQGDPWGLLWRSFTGNFAAYGVSLSWLLGRVPRLTLPAPAGLFIFLGFLISLGYSLRGRAAYLFILLWFAILLLPSILSPDIIPHDLRTIGATTPAYVMAAVFGVWLFEKVRALGRRWVRPRLAGTQFNWLARGVGVALALLLLWIYGRASLNSLVTYFFVWPETEVAQAAYHVYAVELAEAINHESRSEVAFILPRNTAAGDVFRNFTTDFLVELEQPPAAHYWVIDDETTLADDLTEAAAEHSIMRVVLWKTSKHTGADPKDVIPYYLEKYGHYERTDTFEYFDIETYRLEAGAPDFHAAESLHPIRADFGDQLQLTGYALGDAGSVDHVTEAQAASGDLLWLRLRWQKSGQQPENLKVSAQVFTAGGRLVSQIDKLLLSNILQLPSTEWEPGAQAETYFLIPIPPATPPSDYALKLAVYGQESLARLAVAGGEPDGLLALADFTVTPPQQPPSPDLLDLALPVNQELLPGLTLVGFETLPGESVRSGQRLGASLIWQAGERPIRRDWAMALSARAGEGEEEWPLSEPVGLAGAYPPTRWQAGELLRGWLPARIPPSLEPGLYKLRLRLVDTNDPSAEPLILPVGDFQVEGWPREFDPPRPQVELAADFGGQATLVGLDADAVQLTPGETLLARLHWRVEAEFEQNYTAFIHLIGPDGRLYGQVDQVPGGGAYPTTGWLPGEYIADDYAVALAPDAPPGDYLIEIGMYDPNTGQRLAVTPAECRTEDCRKMDDKVLLPGLVVQ